MKILKCHGCGSNLSGVGEDLKCEYCGLVTRVETISHVINKLLAGHLREKYSSVKSLVAEFKFDQADDVLTEILATDPTQAPALFLKSLMPHYKHEKKLAFIDAAIKQGTESQVEFFTAEREAVVKKEQIRIRRIRLKNFAIIGGGLVLLAGGTFLILWGLL